VRLIGVCFRLSDLTNAKERIYIRLHESKFSKFSNFDFGNFDVSLTVPMLRRKEALENGRRWRLRGAGDHNASSSCSRMNDLHKDKMCPALNMASFQVYNIISIGLASHKCLVPTSRSAS
jgi:hypothetical protein